MSAHPERHLKAAVDEMKTSKIGQPTKPYPWIRISKYCVHRGCKKIGVFAERISNGMWVVRCAEHVHKTIQLDMSKIPEEKPNGWTPGDKL